LFEVEEAVNKIRAEVDPEAELIFGAIEDTNLNGKIRVSIVATSLDGYENSNKTVLNMFSRVQNRNNGYSDGLFSNNTRVESNTLSSIEGATALKLDESYEINDEQNAAINFENILDNKESESTSSYEQEFKDVPSGVSMENASYMENNINNIQENDNSNSTLSDDIIKEYTPKLFSEDQNFQESFEKETIESNENNTDHLFDQDINEEEDFEIPAFLRKQKF
jgi:cell division protein FtsZ